MRHTLGWRGPIVVRSYLVVMANPRLRHATSQTKRGGCLPPLVDHCGQEASAALTWLVPSWVEQQNSNIEPLNLGVVPTGKNVIRRSANGKYGVGPTTVARIMDEQRKPGELMSDREGSGGTLTSLRLFLGSRPWLTAWLVVASVVAGLSMSAILATLAEIAAALVAKRSTVAFSVGPLHVTARVTVLTVVGLSAVLVQVLMQVVLVYLPARIMGDLQAELRARLFSAFASAPPPSQSSDGEGQFQELVTNQVTQVLQGTQQATGIVTNGLMLVIMILTALAVGPVATLIVTVAGLGVFVALRPLNKIGGHHGRALSEAQVDYAAGVHQAVHLAEEATIFGVTAVQQRLLSKLSDTLRKRLVATQFVGRVASSGYQSAILLLLFGGVSLLEVAGVGQLTSLGVIVLLLVRGSTYANQFYGSYHWLQQLVPFMDRLRRAEERFRETPPVRGSRSLNTVPTLAFNDVSYSYTPRGPRVARCQLPHRARRGDRHRRAHRSGEIHPCPTPARAAAPGLRPIPAKR